MTEDSQRWAQPLIASVLEALCLVRLAAREDMVTPKASPAPAAGRAEARRHLLVLAGRLRTGPISPPRRGSVSRAGSVVGPARTATGVTRRMLELPAVVGQRFGSGALRPSDGITPGFRAAVDAETEADSNRDGSPRWGIRRVPLRRDPPQVGRDRPSQRIGAPLASNSA